MVESRTTWGALPTPLIGNGFQTTGWSLDRADRRSQSLGLHPEAMDRGHREKKIFCIVPPDDACLDSITPQGPSNRNRLP